MKKLLTLIILLTGLSGVAYAQTFTIDNVEQTEAEELIKVDFTVIANNVREVSCRAFDSNGNVIGSGVRLIARGDTGWSELYISKQGVGANVKCQSKLY